MIVAAVPVSGTAAPRCEPFVSSNKQWSAALARPVTVKAPSVTLKAALERVATAAGLRFSYSADLLPLEREVCLSYQQAAVGDLLEHLLKGVAVRPIAAGADHVVLAPAVAREEVVREPEALVPLDPIFATARQSPLERHESGVGVTRIGREQIARYASVAQALSAHVPGVWAWQSPSGFTAHYSMRGAASFGASAPKIYIDGIEVANPLLATQIQPDNIERIEVIRGPQGSALYGADAISGVTNIVTRHDVAEAGAPRVHVRSGLALSSSDFTAGSELGQDHTVAVRMGSPLRSGALNFGIGSVGEYVPGAYARHFNFDGSMRLVTDRTLITGSARFSNQSTRNPFGLLSESAAGSSALSLQHYTVGARAVVQQNERLVHTFVLGADGYALGNVPLETSFGFSTADSVLRAAGDGALRATARVSSVLRLRLNEHASTAITLAAEHSNLHQYGELPEPSSTVGKSQPVTGSETPPSQSQSGALVARSDGSTSFEQSRRANGLMAQVDATLFERALLTAGLRVEHDQINGVDLGISTLPMVSAGYLIGSETVNARLRAAYGKAIRWPEMRMRVTQWPTYSQSSAVLTPETQAGLEAGVDLRIGRALEVQLTRFDQTATGLMQGVITMSRTLGSDAGIRPDYCLQTVGEIANHGWELQTSLRRGAFTLTGGMSFVESRVLRVASGYAGDLQAGDRMLGVPARTASIAGSWTGAEWSTSLTAYRAFDWISYDRLALAVKQPGEVVGPQLRDYWKHYNGSTHLRATFTRTLTDRFTLLLSADNLLDKQTGEPDNLTVVPGRTFSFGAKASF